MNTIQPHFLRTQYRPHLNMQPVNTIKNSIQVNTATLSTPTPENIKANYLINFKGGMKFEKSEKSSIGTLNHQTAFFREPKTDEIVQKYILENFTHDDEINIVSGACSTGEEAKSYAMMLDNIKDKLNIFGFDISKDVIEDAKSGECQLIKATNNQFTNDLESENILLDDNVRGLSEYQRKCRDKFNQYYTPKGPDYEVPVFPHANEELQKLDELLNNIEEFEKQKKQYEEQKQILKKAQPEISEYLPKFEDTLKMGMQALKIQSETYKTVKDFSTDMNLFNNCAFTQGDILKLDKLYEPNSVNVLLYRNALYHSLCIGDSMFRCMKDDANDTMDLIAKQMNKVLKPQGLVVFGEEEYMQGINSNVIGKIMKNNGFKLLQEGDANNIWVKVKDIEKQ